MASNNAEGYSVTFVETEIVNVLDSDCTICLLVMRDPILIVQCGHSFCDACLANWIQTCEFPVRCPIDNTVFDQSLVYPDLKLKRSLGSMLVYCKNEDHGCSVTPEFRHLDEHMDACLFRMVSCPLLCGEKLVVSSVGCHLVNECPNKHTPQQLRETTTALTAELSEARGTNNLLNTDLVQAKDTIHQLTANNYKLVADIETLKITQQQQQLFNNAVDSSASKRRKSGKQQNKQPLTETTTCNKSRDGKNRCPLTWRVLVETDAEERTSECFYTQRGYKMCVTLCHCHGDVYSVDCRLVAGEDDDELAWPWSEFPRLSVRHAEPWGVVEVKNPWEESAAQRPLNGLDKWVFGCEVVCADKTVVDVTVRDNERIVKY